MTTISAAEFKAKCLKLMDQIHRTGRSIVVTKRGLPVAKLVAVEPKTDLPIFGCLRNSISISADIIAPVGESWDAE
jgi:prevent-host-death family protein